jgi:hypothetical protein
MSRDIPPTKQARALLGPVGNGNRVGSNRDGAAIAAEGRGGMRIYTNTKTGVRISGRVIQVAEGYRVTEFRQDGACEGWHLMRRTYKKLSTLLRAAEGYRYNVELDS